MIIGENVKNICQFMRYICIVGNMFSGWFFTNSGVRQGDSLSPTLFALFINRLAEEKTDEQSRRC